LACFIILGGLSWQTTEGTLRAHFEKYGELTDVALMIDKRTGQPRYAHVIAEVHLRGTSSLISCLFAEVLASLSLNILKVCILPCQDSFYL
jgi:hypothetical protein